MKDFTHAAGCTRKHGQWDFENRLSDRYSMEDRARALRLRDIRELTAEDGVPPGRRVVCDTVPWNTGNTKGVSFFYYEVW